MRKTSRSATLQAAVLAFGLFLVPGQISGQIDITRSQFTPPVVPETQIDPVRFEVTVTGGPASVLFRYNGIHRPMWDGKRWHTLATLLLPTGFSISILLLFAT